MFQLSSDCSSHLYSIQRISFSAVMDDDGWDPPVESLPASQPSSASSSQASASEAGSPQKSRRVKNDKKKRKKKGGKAKAKASPKKTPVSKSRVLDKSCFICPNKKKANSRFCLVHNPPAECIKNQAVAKNELKAFDEVMYNKEKCKLAVEEFMRENPPGKFRKKLIDFGQWRKSYGVRTSTAVHENESEFTAGTWQSWATSFGGYDSPRARAKWKEMMKDPNLDRQGEGADMMIWACTIRTRQRTRERYEDGNFEESSKQLKNLSNQDVDSLKTFALSSASSHTSSFLRSNVGNDVAPVDEAPLALSNINATKRKINLSTAGPRAQAKHEKDLNKFVGLIEKDNTDLNSALDFYEAYLKTAGDEEVPREIILYKRVLEINKGLLGLWQLDFVEASIVSNIQLQAAQNPATPAPAKPAGALGPVPMTPAARPWDSSSGQSPPQGVSPTPSSSPVAPGTPGGKEAKVKHSTNACTVQFVQCLRSLPVRYHPSRSYDEMFTLNELKVFVEDMNVADTAEQLDRLVGKFLTGIAQANIFRDQVREAARCVRSAIVNHQRAVERRVKVEQSRIVLVYMYLRVSVGDSLCSLE